MADNFARPEPRLSNANPSDNRPDPVIRIARAEATVDWVTILAMIFSILLVVVGISMGNQNANFLDVPSILIVILGTIAVTCISYTGRELRLALPIIRSSIVRMVYAPARLASDLIDLAVITRRRGLLILNMHTDQLERNPFLNDVMQMVTDGMTAPEIDRLVHQDIDMMLEGYKKAAGMLRRASEIAPAMGLIGTLIGLVQMLVALDDPSSIGPAMALALLTTFYGAIMGTMVLAPLAAKLERNANEEMMIKSLVQTTALAMIAQTNPRKLELDLNSLLPPDQRVRYFDNY
jgi:chemotaxis protein MotA